MSKARTTDLGEGESEVWTKSMQSKATDPLKQEKK